MTYLKNKNIEKAISVNLSNKYVYATNMHSIYNIIVGQTKNQPQEKLISYATFQVANTGQYPIRYLIILNKLWFSNPYEQHPIQCLWLTKRWLYNTIQHTNKNMTDYQFSFCKCTYVQRDV